MAILRLVTTFVFCSRIVRRTESKGELTEWIQMVK